MYLQLKSRLLEPVRGIDLERRRLSLALHNGRVVEALNAVKDSLFIRLGPSPAPAWLREALQIYFVAQDCLTLARVIQQRGATVQDGVTARALDSADHRVCVPAQVRRHAQAPGAAHQRHGVGLGVAALIP